MSISSGTTASIGRPLASFTAILIVKAVDRGDCFGPSTRICSILSWVIISKAPPPESRWIGICVERDCRVGVTSRCSSKS